MRKPALSLMLLLLLGLAACRPAPPDDANASATGDAGDEAPGQLSMTRELSGDPQQPSIPLDVHVTLHYTGDSPVQVLEVTEHLPENWVFEEVVEGEQPDILPIEGSQGEMIFVWLKVQEFPLHFTYRMHTGDSPPAPPFIQGQTTYQSTGPEVRSEVLTTLLSEDP